MSEMLFLFKKRALIQIFPCPKNFSFILGSKQRTLGLNGQVEIARENLKDRMEKQQQVYVQCLCGFWEKLLEKRGTSKIEKC